MYVLKSIISIQTIMCIRLFFGFYYKISSNLLVDVLVRAYCVFLVSLLNLQNYLLTTHPLIAVKVRHGLLGTLYAINVCTGLLFGGENLFEFLKKIRKIALSPKPNDEIPFSRIWFLVLLLGKLTTHLIYGYCISEDLLNLFSPVTMLSLTFQLAQHTSNFTRIIVFEILWHRIAMLRIQLERSLSTARRFENREENTNMRKRLRSCLNTYKNILNTTHETDAPMKFMMFWSMLLMIPKILDTIYLFITYDSVCYSSYLLLYEGFIEFAVTVTPAVLAEMVNSEIDKMKLCLVKQLLVCRGEAARDAIDDAMMFFRHHPFKYTIWRLFSLDMSMILSAVALLTTYTIAMVQFAHFYN